MAVYDLTGQKYNIQSAPFQVGGDFFRKILLTGAQLKALTTTATDNFKICRLGQNVAVKELSLLVLDKDAADIQMKIGYTDGTTTDDDAYDAAATGDLNALGYTKTLNLADMTKNAMLIGETAGADFFLIITLSALTIEDDTEFVIEVRGNSYSDVPYAATLLTPPGA